MSCFCVKEKPSRVYGCHSDAVNAECVFVLQEIDNMIAKASEQGYSAVVTLGSKGISYAANVLMSTAAKVWY